MTAETSTGHGTTRALVSHAVATVCRFALVSLPTLLGCAAGTYHFDGERTMSASETAVLSVQVNQVFGLQPVIESLDSQVIHEHGSLQRVDVQLTLPPGRHQAAIWWSNQRAFGAQTCARTAKVVTFDAVAGHRYGITIRARKEVACVLGGGDDWDVAVVDQ